MPDVVHVRQGISYRLASSRIAFIGQFAITIYGVVAAPLQFFADRSFAGARNTLDQVISNAHRQMIARST
jgi:hypothetical protein